MENVDGVRDWAVHCLIDLPLKVNFIAMKTVLNNKIIFDCKVCHAMQLWALNICTVHCCSLLIRRH